MGDLLSNSKKFNRMRKLFDKNERLTQKYRQANDRVKLVLNSDSMREAIFMFDNGTPFIKPDDLFHDPDDAEDEFIKRKKKKRRKNVYKDKAARKRNFIMFKTLRYTLSEVYDDVEKVNNIYTGLVKSGPPTGFFGSSYLLEQWNGGTRNAGNWMTSDE